MEQENQQNDNTNPESLPTKRIRVHAQMGEVPVSEPSSRIQQQHSADPPTVSNQGFVGQSVSGVFNGTFGPGYLLTVRMGTTGLIFKGMVFFDAHTSRLISAENDIPPNPPLSNPNDMVPPTMPQTSDRAFLPARDQPAQQNVRADQAPPRFGPAAVCGSVWPVQQTIRAPQAQTSYVPPPVPHQVLQRNEPAAVPIRAPQALPVQPLSRVGPAGGFTPYQPMQQNVRAALPVQSTEVGLPFLRRRVTNSSPYTQNVVLNEAGRVLQQGWSIRQVSSIRCEAMNVQIAKSGGPGAAVVKEEEAPVTIPPRVQTKAAVEAPQGSAFPDQRGSASGSAVQLSGPQTRVARTKPAPKDSSSETSS